MKEKTNCRIWAFGIAFATWVAMPVMGQGTVIIQHSGATDPTAEGWTGFAVGGSPVTNDMGVDAWSTSQYVDYQYDLSPQQQAELTGGWIFSVNVKITTRTTAANQFIASLFGPEQLLLWFGSTPSGDPLVNLNYGPGMATTNTFALTGAGMSYNLYQLNYNRSADMLSFWINGAEYATNLPARGTSME